MLVLLLLVYVLYYPYGRAWNKMKFFDMHWISKTSIDMCVFFLISHKTHQIHIMVVKLWSSVLTLYFIYISTPSKGLECYLAIFKLNLDWFVVALSNWKGKLLYDFIITIFIYCTYSIYDYLFSKYVKTFQVPSHYGPVRRLLNVYTNYTVKCKSFSLHSNVAKMYAIVRLSQKMTYTWIFFM